MRTEQKKDTWHTLKTDAYWFSLIWENLKTFELRFNDRSFKKGDYLSLKETRFSCEEMKNGKPLEFTKREVHAEITDVFNESFGLKDGFVILSFRIISKLEVL